MADDNQDTETWDNAEFLERVFQATEAAVSTQQQQLLLWPPPPINKQPKEMEIKASIEIQVRLAYENR
nr:hypothetical protein [Tanacetum cinerariifolium]